MDLSNLKPAVGSKHSDSFRRGRGHASGNGKTAGKGHKGQKAQSGAPRPGFEGVQSRYVDVSRREASQTEILRPSLVSNSKRSERLRERHSVRLNINRSRHRKEPA